MLTNLTKEDLIEFETEMYWENTIELRKDESVFEWTSGNNSDSPRVVDLRGKTIPSNVSAWRPALFRNT